MTSRADDGPAQPACDPSASDAAAVASAKRVLRSAVRLRRDSRTEAQRRQDDERRFAQLTELLPPGSTRRLAAYLSAGTEPDSLRLVAWALTHGIEVLLPVLTDGAGSWLPAPTWAAYEGADRLRVGRSQILEPTGPPIEGDALRQVDLVIAPGLAADRTGRRLGRGGGWYDRARSRHPDLETWLLLNDDELLEVVPSDAWDLPVHRVITPNRVIMVSSAGGSPPA